MIIPAGHCAALVVPLFVGLVIALALYGVSLILDAIQFLIWLWRQR